MSPKTKVIIIIAALAASFAAGRFSTPEKVRVETKTVEVEKKQTDVDRDSELARHRETTTTKTTRPDGTVEETTKTVEDAARDSQSRSEVTDNITIDQTSTKEVSKNASPVTISALAGLKITDLSNSPIEYGVSISRPILGPVTIGLWGLSSGVGGFSIGLQF